jgi:hypothetical protein
MTQSEMMKQSPRSTNAGSLVSTCVSQQSDQRAQHQIALDLDAIGGAEVFVFEVMFSPAALTHALSV